MVLGLPLCGHEVAQRADERPLATGLLEDSPYHMDVGRG